MREKRQVCEKIRQVSKIIIQVCGKIRSVWKRQVCETKKCEKNKTSEWKLREVCEEKDNWVKK